MLINIVLIVVSRTYRYLYRRKIEATGVQRQSVLFKEVVGFFDRLVPLEQLYLLSVIATSSLRMSFGPSSVKWFF